MTMLKNALAIVERGWPVFPCDPKTKQPLVKGDRDPETGDAIPNTGGVKKATTDVNAVRAWWTRWPKAMIGIPTGPSIGAFVIDVDAGEDKNTGEVFEAAALQLELERELGCQLPVTLTARTPRGGVHLYFALPDGEPPGNRAGIIKRVDVRGDGGYVIAPPSVRNDDKAYQWVSSHVTPIASAPPALLDMIFRRGRGADAPAPIGGSISARAAAAVKPPKGNEAAGITEVDEAMRKYGLTAMDAEARQVRLAQKGERNNQLNISALKLGQLVAAGVVNESLVRAVLENAAAECGLVGSDGGNSVRKTISSGLRKGMSQPRDLEEVRRAAETRLTRRPRTAADRTSSSPASSSASSASSAAAPPPSATNGKPSSQTGATAKNSCCGRGRGRAQAAEAGRERRRSQHEACVLSVDGSRQRGTVSRAI